MRKWTYLVAALLSAGVTVGTFSSCIDNDEPEGINILRKAKAELISFKKALVEAQAKQAEAEAAKANAEAEYKKAEAEVLKLNAEAERLREDAESAARIKEIEEQIALLQAQTQAAIQAAEDAHKAAAQALAEAEYNFEKLKVETAEENAKAIEYWYTRYTNQQSKYTTAYENWLTAQRAYALAQLQFNDGSENETCNDDYQTGVTLKNNVEDAERELAEAQANIADLTAELEAAKNMEPSELGQKYDEYQAELKEITKAQNALDLELAEIKKENIAEYNKLDELVTELGKLTDPNLPSTKANIEIPEFTYVFPNDEILKGNSYSGASLTGEIEVIGKDKTFWVNANEIPLGDYNYAFGRLRGYRDQVKSALLDENDLAWNAAQINEMKAEKTALEAEIADLKDKWQEAVDVYNNGNTPDITKFTISGYTELKAAVDTYNALVAPTNVALKAWKDAEKAVQDAVEAKTEAKEWLEIRDAAYDEAWEAYYDAQNAANEAYDEARNKAQNAITNAWNDWMVAQDKLNAAYYAWLADPTEANETAYDAAAEAYQEGFEAWDEARNDWEKSEYIDGVWTITEGSLQKAAREAREKAIALARSARHTAYAEADQAYAKAIADGTVSEKEEAIAALQAAQAVEQEANIAYNGGIIDDEEIEGAKTKLENAFSGDESFKVALTNLCNNTNYAVSDNWTEDIDNWTEEEEKKRKDEDDNWVEIDITEVASITNASAKQLLKNRSHSLYGTGFSRDNTNDGLYGIPYEQLIDLDKATVDKTIQAYYPGVENFQLYTFYSEGNFGQFGKLLRLEHDIQIAEAYVDNPTIVETAVAAFNEQLDALEKSKEDRIAEIKENKAAQEVQKEVIAELEEPIAAKRFELNRKNQLYTSLVEGVLKAAGYDKIINLDEDNKLNEEYSQEALDKYIKYIEEKIQYLTDGEKNDSNPVDGESLRDLQDAVDKAKHMLEAWESGELTVAAAKKFELEKAENKLNQAKELLDYYKADLDKAIERLEAAE